VARDVALGLGDAMKELVKDALPTSLVEVAFGSFEGKPELEKEAGLDEKSLRASMLGVVQAAVD
jgi:hypothetical protein